MPTFQFAVSVTQVCSGFSFVVVMQLKKTDV